MILENVVGRVKIMFTRFNYTTCFNSIIPWLVWLLKNRIGDLHWESNKLNKELRFKKKKLLAFKEALTHLILIVYIALMFYKEASSD